MAILNSEKQNQVYLFFLIISFTTLFIFSFLSSRVIATHRAFYCDYAHLEKQIAWEVAMVGEAGCHRCRVSTATAP
jgi:hypothetical protein